MIWSAAEAGADYVKIQSMLSNELTYRKRFEHGLTENGIQKVIKRPYRAEYERLKSLDLDDEAYNWFVKECQKALIKPLTTVFTRSRVSFLANLPWMAVKVASYDCASYPLLRDLKSHFDHLFISTGATYDYEIEESASVLGDQSFTFLHCVTIYPTPMDALNLARLAFLRKLAPSIGFSDHSLVARDGLKASIAALALGADVIERHYTILPTEETKDGAVSISPVLLKELVDFAHIPQEDLDNYVQRHIPEFSAMIGVETRTLSPEEELNRDYYRGRFASQTMDGQVIYNWEDESL